MKRTFQPVCVCGVCVSSVLLLLFRQRETQGLGPVLASSPHGLCAAGAMRLPAVQRGWSERNRNRGRKEKDR